MNRARNIILTGALVSLMTAGFAMAHGGGMRGYMGGPGFGPKGPMAGAMFGQRGPMAGGMGIDAEAVRNTTDLDSNQLVLLEQIETSQLALRQAMTEAMQVMHDPKNWENGQDPRVAMQAQRDAHWEQMRAHQALVTEFVDGLSPEQKADLQVMATPRRCGRW